MGDQKRCKILFAAGSTQQNEVTVANCVWTVTTECWSCSRTEKRRPGAQVVSVCLCLEIFGIKLQSKKHSSQPEHCIWQNFGTICNCQAISGLTPKKDAPQQAAGHKDAAEKPNEEKKPPRGEPKQKAKTKKENPKEKVLEFVWSPVCVSKRVVVLKAFCWKIEEKRKTADVNWLQNKKKKHSPFVQSKKPAVTAAPPTHDGSYTDTFESGGAKSHSKTDDNVSSLAEDEKKHQPARPGKKPHLALLNPVTDSHTP